jgi:hypothetical protein
MSTISLSLYILGISPSLYVRFASLFTVGNIVYRLLFLKYYDNTSFYIVILGLVLNINDISSTSLLVSGYLRIYCTSLLKLLG